MRRCGRDRPGAGCWCGPGLLRATPRPYAAAMALACAPFLLGARAPPARAEVSGSGSAVARDPTCAGLRGGGPLLYRNPHWGFAVTYPSIFALDPGSVTEGGASLRFWTADRRATAVVTALRNGMGQSLSDLRREAKRDIVENGRGTIGHEGGGNGWFVLRGSVAGHLFYRRTFLARGGRIIATLWIEFPPGMPPCFEAAVAMMSLSFREAAP